MKTILIPGWDGFAVRGDILYTPIGQDIHKNQIDQYYYTLGLLNSNLRDLERQLQTLRAGTPQRVLARFLQQDQPTPADSISPCVRTTTAGITTTIPSVFAMKPASNFSGLHAPTTTATKNPPLSQHSEDG